jgi:arsenate reductase (thioredoxin)
MTKIMFLCTGNSCRSQMAEGFARYLGDGVIEACSAGTMPASCVNPYAVKVMKEVGLDISGQKPKMIDYKQLNLMDVVVTLCGEADKSCPALPLDIRRIHMPVADPSGTVGNEDEILAAFRKTREEIKIKIEQLLPEILKV